MQQLDSASGGGFPPAVDDLGVEPIARSLARARQQAQLREQAGEDASFWRRREIVLGRALRHAQRKVRARRRARLALTNAIRTISRHIAPRPRGAGRPGLRRTATAPTSGGDPPDGEHETGRRAAR